ncbi:unnamed protein product [Chilo suppressalis]|uniref:Uncharacterized protein n=1 Tax=Chilo suppressalis TaxID=168631 RepID=A0ABN8LAJ5_CHISP|nr:unnamed protein product [Chilo suppressalis]
MPSLKVPHALSLTIEAHNKWLEILKNAQELIDTDIEMQEKSAAGVRLKERHLPAEVLGRTYAQYCALVNKMYDAFLNNVQLQRETYMKDIVSVFLKRIYELRNEIVHLIVNDYIYVDEGLTQLKLTPEDIQIVVPYHYPLECRSESSELLLQKMWHNAEKRKNATLKRKTSKTENKVPVSKEYSTNLQSSGDMSEYSCEDQQEDKNDPSIELTVTPEEYIQANIIQRHERFRQFFMMDFKAKCIKRRTYFASKTKEAPLPLKIAAAQLIQKTYRAYMKSKREHILDTKRDMMLGLIPNSFSNTLKYDEENNKLYERRRKTRSRLNEIFLEELEKERIRLIMFKKEDQIDDITDEIREWFKDWYYGYGFFPEFPHELEGGTLMVVRGEYPSIEEKIESDEKYLAATKGKTKDQLKDDAARAKADALMKAQAEKQKERKEAQQLLKLRCDPFSDPGYEVKRSEVRHSLIEAIHRYRSVWSIHDRFPPDKSGEVVYGFIKTFLTEDLMEEIHVDCRKYVDELMRLDLKLLIKMQQTMYKRIGWKYPKIKPRKKPKMPQIQKPLNVDKSMLKEFEDYQVYVDFFLDTNPTLKKEREEYAIINNYREIMYKKMAEIKKKKKAER